MLKSHVGLRLKTDAGTEDVGQSTALLSKCIDNWRSGWSQRSLEHVAEDAENAVEVLVVLSGNTIAGLCLPGDTSHHLGDQNQINDERGSQQGILADIEETKLVSTLK